VKAGRIHVRAVGTAFDVRRAGDRVVVTVQEGKVDVYDAGSPESRSEQRSTVASPPIRPLRVAAGEQLAVNESTAGAAVTSVDASAALAWREGRLEYVSEPLEAVIADINRYAKRPVIIVDESARSLRFSGSVLIDYTDEWVRALPGEFPVRVHEQNGVDVIQSAPSRESAPK
jgi:transmembrane sensor